MAVKTAVKLNIWKELDSMSEKTVKLIYTVYGIVTSILLVITGVLLMIACVQVYSIGDRPFTVENISNEFSKIAVPVFITVIAVAVGFVLWLVKPLTQKRSKAVINKRAMLKRLERRLDLTECSDDTKNTIKKEQTLRLILRVATAGICVGAFIPTLIYVLNFNNFGADYNAAVISAMLWIAPSCLICAGVCIALAYLESASLTRQIATVKSAITKGSTPAEATACKCYMSKLIPAIRLGIAIVAILLIVAGILNGGMADVLSKAVNICTECIGLG